MLLLALLSYYAVSAHYGFMDGLTGAGYGATAFLAYLAGYWAGASRRRPAPLSSASGLLFAVAGGVAFSSASAMQASPAELGYRVAPSIWSGELFNAPGLGALGSLGMCLVAASLLTSSRHLPTRMILWLAFPLIAAAGILLNVALQNRTPFLALGLALFLNMILLLRQARTSRVARAFQLAFALGAGSVALLLSWRYLPSIGIVQRFEAEGLRTARYETWLTALRGVVDHPAGGREILLTERFAHNLWLDMGWEAGLVPAVLLLAFHLLHVRPALRFFRGSDAIELKATLLPLGASFLLTCIAEPVTAYPIAYLSLLNYFLGLLLALGGFVQPLHGRRPAATA